jgi:hypothetical protein
MMCQQAKLACDPLLLPGLQVRILPPPPKASKASPPFHPPWRQRKQAGKSPLACHELAPRLGDAGKRWPWGGLQREHSMYTASKRYLAASVSALTLAIMLMLLAIAAWSIAPDVAADTSEITAQLKKSLPP